ncbi:G-protein coupled receptor dmsr-1-like [Argopecten irradians]|uniref:G-protein coupled receptor dmsr-1-like n=1 Tax=Argopecten irradians TaxID=31199 RepID=UPI00371421E7
MADSINTTYIFSNETDPGFYPKSTLEQFSAWYGGIHGYLSLIVCFFGIPTNFINITVLTRKHMETPINLVLTWMAVSDLLTMASYVPFAIHFYCNHPSTSISPDKNSFKWMSYLLFHVNFSATTHTISIWLGVSLAIFRYHHIQSPETGNFARMRRLIKSRIVIFGIITGSVLLLIPNYMSTNLELLRENSSMYVLEDLKLGTEHVKPVVFLNLSLYSVVAKFIPCFLMLVYGALLLRTLDMQVRIKRRRLSKLGVIIQRPLHTSRTTVMLLAVLVLFLITELPQGILIVLSLIRAGFFEDVYIPLGDVMDILALVNNGVNFILYCSMNREFRRTLLRMMCTMSAERKSSLGTELITDSMRKCSLLTDRNASIRNDFTHEDVQTFNLRCNDGNSVMSVSTQRTVTAEKHAGTYHNI